MSNSDLFCKKMGDNLKKLQENRNMTDEEFSCVLGITVEQLNQYKDGSRLIDLNIIIRLDEGLYNSRSDIIIDELLDDVEQYSHIIKVTEQEKHIIYNLRHMDSNKKRWICGEIISLISCASGNILNTILICVSPFLGLYI